MKDNKRIDVKKIYYVTLENLETNQKDYAIVEFKNGIYTNIKTDEQYKIQKDNRIIGPYKSVYSIKNNIQLYGITPYTGIVYDIFGKRTIKEILEIDKFISKIYDEEYDEYIFSNTQEIQKTFAIVRSDSKNNIIKTIEMIYNSGLTIEKYEVRTLDEEISNKLYRNLMKKRYYLQLKECMLPKEVVIMVLEGVNAVEKFKNLMGPNDSTKAQKGTIRGEFGTDTLYNAIYGSDSEVRAEIEINQFFKEKQKRI